ncbi:MAG TPA: hypothetical protein P5250_08200 [Bacteroidales bacterium]|nr:hypothetical protein [Bacteroidales bacterium]
MKIQIISKLLKVFFTLFCLVITNINYAQSPAIIINGTPVLVDDASTFPFWINSGTTLEVGNKVNYISVIQYNIVPSLAGGNILQFDNVVMVTTQQTVPQNKVWKIEAIAKDITSSNTSTYQFPTGTNSQTIRHDSNNWVADYNISNNGINVGIGTSAPDASAKLDIKSTDKGILIPRVSLISVTDVTTVTSPAISLLVYNTNDAIINGNGVGFYYWNGSTWVKIDSNNGPSNCLELEMPHAGTAIYAVNGSTVKLAGNTPINALGTWSILSGIGGNIINPNNPNSDFTGNNNSTYELKWTFSLSGCPSVSDISKVVFSTANYPNGNEAYWTEKSNGFRPVTIANDTTIFVYDVNNKMYKNISGSLILLPTISRQGSVQPETVNATNFYGYLGGSASNNKFQWDGLATLPGNIYDVYNVFVSPVSPVLNYCQVLQYSYSGLCNSSSSDITYATTTFSYANTPNGLGPYNVYNGGDLIPTTVTGSFGARRYSQQSMVGDGYNDSYCVATYGKGWRIPTDIEVGRPNNLNDNGTPPLNPGYVGTTNIQMWTSTIACQSGGGTCYTYYRQTWRLDNSSYTWPWSSGQLGIETAKSTRCIYTGGL